MHRREFISPLGGVAVIWPLAARAQQPAMPVVGFLRNTIAAPFAHLVAELGKGLSEEGFVEGRNVIIEQRWGPKMSVVAVLLDPDTTFEIELVETAARALGLQIVPVKLASERDLDAAPPTKELLTRWQSVSQRGAPDGSCGACLRN
jgi:hypothetical protein